MATHSPHAPDPLAGTAARTQTPAAEGLAELDSRELMRGSREVLIHHAGHVYRLRHTRNDKLILVK